nr:AAA family ATPase [Melioribacter roseus]
MDLECIDNRELFSEKNYDNIILSLASPGLDFKENALIGIDEIQLLPGIVSAIKYLYDNYRIKFIITGSNNYYINNLFGESLAGRKKVFELSTLRQAQRSCKCCKKSFVFSTLILSRNITL